MRKIRIGIDVGGTFTHAVALELDAQGVMNVVSHSRVPTTHDCANGVGEGIVQSLKQVIETGRITNTDIHFIAHSTTQATNSLLEGDVESVGILAFARNTLELGFVRRATSFGGAIALGGDRAMRVHSRATLYNADSLSKTVKDFCAELRAKSINVAVVTSPFSTENPEIENEAEKHFESSFFVCKTHEISSLYGLRVRTRTTAINASILPKMLSVADVTQREIRNLGIKAPLMIMRSDGGVMTIDEMKKRPILTLLSGPAAGIAAALRFIRVSDGIFLEVGGTSTDISAIRNGRAMIRTASIGGFQTHLKTLDCRTLGIGGGSIPRVQSDFQVVKSVGPRSAHLAGLKYFSFTAPEQGPMRTELASPKSGDPSDYLMFRDAQDIRFGFTPTCAANLLGDVRPQDSAHARPNWEKDVEAVFGGIDGAKSFAKKMLARVAKQIRPTIETLQSEYRLDNGVVLIGGGGGAGAILPTVARDLGLASRVAEMSDVISAVGVGLGVLRETYEVSVPEITTQEIIRARQAAQAALIKQGADPKSIEIFVEIDQHKRIISAHAQGNADLVRAESENSEDFLAPLEAQLTKTGFHILGESKLGGFTFRTWEKSLRPFLGVIPRKSRMRLWVLDSNGVLKLQANSGTWKESNAEKVIQELRNEMEARAHYGDGGVEYPSLFVTLGEKLIDLSGISDLESLFQILHLEIKEAALFPTAPVGLLFTPRV